MREAEAMLLQQAAARTYLPISGVPAYYKAVQQKAPAHDVDFMTRQRGMFSYSGLTKEQVARLRNEFSMCAVDTGRISMATLNASNIDHVTDAIAKVM